LTLRIALLLAAAACLALPVAATATGSSTPAVGTDADAADLSTVRGAQPFEGGYAVPLKGETARSWASAPQATASTARAMRSSC
jgi:hypothetical protein